MLIKDSRFKIHPAYKSYVRQHDDDGSSSDYGDEATPSIASGMSTPVGTRVTDLEKGEDLIDLTSYRIRFDDLAII